MTLLWALLAASTVVANEIFCAKFPGTPWIRVFFLMLPLHPITSYAIYRIVTTGSILDVAIYFSGSTALLRLGAAVWIGQPVSEATMVAYGLTIAALVIKVGSILLVKGA